LLICSQALVPFRQPGSSFGASVSWPGAHRVLVFYVPIDNPMGLVNLGQVLLSFSLGGIMGRSKMSRGRSRRQFKNGVERSHPKNRMSGYFMRGGIRL